MPFVTSVLSSVLYKDNEIKRGRTGSWIWNALQKLKCKLPKALGGPFKIEISKTHQRTSKDKMLESLSQRTRRRSACRVSPASWERKPSLKFGRSAILCIHLIDKISKAGVKRKVWKKKGLVSASTSSCFFLSVFFVKTAGKNAVPSTMYNKTGRNLQYPMYPDVPLSEVSGHRLTVSPLL